MRGSDNKKKRIFLFFYFFRATKGKPVCIPTWVDCLTPYDNPTSTDQATSGQGKHRDQ